MGYILIIVILKHCDIIVFLITKIVKFKEKNKYLLLNLFQPFFTYSILSHIKIILIILYTLNKYYLFFYDIIK